MICEFCGKEIHDYNAKTIILGTEQGALRALLVCDHCHAMWRENKLLKWEDQLDE